MEGAVEEGGGMGYERLSKVKRVEPFSLCAP
jgi:hypothetical protein